VFYEASNIGSGRSAVVFADGKLASSVARNAAGRLREECVNVRWFCNLFDSRSKVGCRRNEYNQPRPHSAPNLFSPEEFRRQCSASPSLGRVTMEIGPATSLDLAPGPTLP